MVASLASLPPATATLAALGYVLPLLPESYTAVLLSATPKEAVDMTLLSYIVKDTHVVHLFDHWSSVREVEHALESYPGFLSSTTPSQESLTQTL
jgi:sulfite reductase (NADPH) flavoprotein alpha-component